MDAKFKIPLILQAVLFLIPLNIYVIGDWIGTGIQTMFFRYQETEAGNGFILLNREIGFVLNGIITGRSAISLVISFVGIALLVIATVLMIYAYTKKNPAFVRYASFLNIGGGILFAISVFIMYGLFLNGPAGIAIPFGIPVLFIIGYWQYRLAADLPENKIENDEEKLGENPEIPEEKAKEN
jgi:hypothetical protein